MTKYRNLLCRGRVSLQLRRKITLSRYNKYFDEDRSRGRKWTHSSIPTLKTEVDLKFVDLMNSSWEEYPEKLNAYFDYFVK